MIYLRGYDIWFFCNKRKEHAKGDSLQLENTRMAMISILKHGINYHLHLHPLTESHSDTQNRMISYRGKSQEDLVIENTPR
jgi:hypothetical protein